MPSFCPTDFLSHMFLPVPATPNPQFEYPGEWPRFFQDLIGVMGQGEGVMDMFCRILVAVDEDLVSLDIPRSVTQCLSVCVRVMVNGIVRLNKRRPWQTCSAAFWWPLTRTWVHWTYPGQVLTVCWYVWRPAETAARVGDTDPRKAMTDRFALIFVVVKEQVIELDTPRSTAQCVRATEMLLGLARLTKGSAMTDSLCGTCLVNDALAHAPAHALAHALAQLLEFALVQAPAIACTMPVCAATHGLDLSAGWTSRFPSQRPDLIYSRPGITRPLLSRPVLTDGMQVPR